MDRMEIVRQALVQLGDAPSHDLSSFIEQTYGVKIEPKYIPLFKATLQNQEIQTRIKAARAAQPSAAT